MRTFRNAIYNINPSNLNHGVDQIFRETNDSRRKISCLKSRHKCVCVLFILVLFVDKHDLRYGLKSVNKVFVVLTPKTTLTATSTIKTSSNIHISNVIQCPSC